MKTGRRQAAGLLRERLGERGDRFAGQVEDRPMGGVPQWLRQSFEFVPGPVGEAENPVTG